MKEPEIYFYFEGDGFGAVNPEVQRVVYGALRDAGARVTGRRPGLRARIWAWVSACAARVGGS